MRHFILTLAALIVLNLVTPACTPAQSTAKQGSEQTIAGAQRDAEAAAKEAQNKAEQAQKEAEAAQEAAARTVNQQERRETLILPSTGVFASTLSSRATPTILVIPVDQIKPEDLAAITEDISVMCRVFDKKLKQEHQIVISTGFQYGFPFGGTTGTEGIYLEGYGVLFLLKVNMPLTPPPETKKEEQPKNEGDTFWEETKHELHSTKEGGGFTGGGYGGGGAMIYAYGLDRSGEEYDPEKVEGLKTTLIRCLKHAANIRNLKPDQSVIITVRGCAPAAVVEETVVEHEEHGSKTHSRTTGITRRVPVRGVESAEESSIASTVLTIRAKKSDIDAFSKGELNFDQFRQKVRIYTY